MHARGNKVLTLDDIRRELRPRWEHALALVDAIELSAVCNAEYEADLNLWLSGKESTVHLRDKIAGPLRNLPEIVEIGKQFTNDEWAKTYPIILDQILSGQKPSFPQNAGQKG